MLEALCDAGGPATCKMPVAPAKRMRAAGAPATCKMQVNTAKRIVAKRMAIFYDDNTKTVRDTLSSLGIRPQICYLSQNGYGCDDDDDDDDDDGGGDDEDDDAG